MLLLEGRARLPDNDVTTLNAQILRVVLADAGGLCNGRDLFFVLVFVFHTIAVSTDH